jgi:galactose mutarotase-like enzyme
MTPLFSASRREAAPAPSFGYAELHGGASRVRLMPALGGKIAELELAGRQWLWKSPVIPFRTGEDGTSYVETADSGGWDECFPTVGACTLPSSAGPWAGLSLPDHGELWARTARLEVLARGDGQEATCVWRGLRLPYRFERTVRVSPSGTVEMRYAAANESDVPLPYLWSAHPLLPLTPDTRVELPEGARVRVWAQHGIDMGGAGAEFRWPHAAARGRAADFSRPARVAGGLRYACKLFVDLPAGRDVAAAVVEGGVRLEVRVDTREVPQMGLWINHRGWTPFRRGKPYCNLAFEPCIGAPDTLSEAFGAWDGAHWLAPGETRYWTLSWTGSRTS